MGITCLLVPLLGTGACDLNPPEPSARESPPHLIINTPAATPSPGSLTVWVLAALGLNVHQQPDTAASTVGTAAQGSELNIDGHRQVGTQTWLKVSAQDQSIAGWILDQPDLVIHQSVDLHIDSDQSWSMLFPTGWTVDAPGAPTGSTTLTGGGITVTVDVEAAAPHFTPPGTDLQDQEIEVYGKTTVLSTYRVPDGSYEIVTRAKWDTTQPVRYFAITYHEPAATQPDTSLCLQLIDSIKIT